MIILASLFIHNSQLNEFETNYCLLRDDLVSLESVYYKRELNNREIMLNQIFLEKSKSKGTIVAVNLGEQIDRNRYSTSCGAMVYSHSFPAFEIYKNNKESGSVLRGEQSFLSKQNIYGWKNSQMGNVFTRVDFDSAFDKEEYVGHCSLTSRLLKEYQFANEHNIFYSLSSVSETSEYLDSAPTAISSRVIVCVSGISRQKNRIVFPQYAGRIHYYRLGYSKQRGYYADLQEVCKI